MYGVTESEKFHIVPPVALLHGMHDGQRDEILRDHAKVNLLIFELRFLRRNFILPRSSVGFAERIPILPFLLSISLPTLRSDSERLEIELAPRLQFLDSIPAR